MANLDFVRDFEFPDPSEVFCPCVYLVLVVFINKMVSIFGGENTIGVDIPDQGILLITSTRGMRVLYCSCKLIGDWKRDVGEHPLLIHRDV